MEPTDQLEFLHISDLHISTKETFGRETVLGALVDRVKKDRKNGLLPEIVVVTGDIAKTGRKEEYAQAEAFFNELLRDFGAGPGAALSRARQSRCQSQSLPAQGYSDL